MFFLRSYNCISYNNIYPLIRKILKLFFHTNLKIYKNFLKNTKVLYNKTMENLQKIKVIGCGGAGCNAIENFMKYFKPPEMLIAADTDEFTLKTTNAVHKIQLGYNGNGAGSDPKKGKLYAEQSIEEIKEMLSGTELLILCAGLGGGTGSGASSVIASVAKELGCTVMGFFTFPFKYDGIKKNEIALESLQQLKETCHFVCTLSNDELVKVTHDKSLKEAFLYLDKIYAAFIYNICNFVTHNNEIKSIINCDFEDLKTFLKQSGEGWIGTGYGIGENAIKDSLEQLYNNPIVLKIPIEEANSMINTIIISEEVTMRDVADLLEEISSKNNTAFIKNGIFSASEEVFKYFPNIIDNSKEINSKEKIIIVSSAFSRFNQNTNNALNKYTEEDKKSEQKKSIFSFWS